MELRARCGAGFFCETLRCFFLFIRFLLSLVCCFQSRSEAVCGAAAEAYDVRQRTQSGGTAASPVQHCALKRGSGETSGGDATRTHCTHT